MINCRPILALTFLLSTCVCATAQVSTVRVGVSDQKHESTILVSPVSGKFAVLNSSGDTLYNFRSDDVLSVSAVGDSMRLLGVYGLDERVTSAMVVGRGPQPSFLVKRSSDGKELRYPGTLTLTVSAGKLSLVNTIDMDTYVSRVVQSEVGNGAHPEYYKIQGIICRTYAVGNRGRHAAQGFDLCDHQHCQVYGAMGDPSESVVKATAATSGIVMADTSARPILATFHANCGGQTANAKDVWAEARSYLISVTDTFCTSQRSAVWTEQVPVEKFRQQFTDADTILVDGFKLQTEHRQSHLTIGKETVRTADLRRDLRLRSAFFDLAVAGDAVLLSGRGFGHGVGLCQQGAMQMAQLGHSYSEILGHYYTNVALVNISSLR